MSDISDEAEAEYWEHKNGCEDRDCFTCYTDALLEYWVRIKEATK